MSNQIDFEGDLDLAQLELNSPALCASLAYPLVAPAPALASTSAPTSAAAPALTSTSVPTSAAAPAPTLTLALTSAEELAEKKRAYQKYSSLRVRTSELLVSCLEANDQSLQRNAATFNLLGKLLIARPRNSPYSKRHKKNNNNNINENNNTDINNNIDNNEIRSYRK